MNPSKMTPDELDDFLHTRTKVNGWLKRLGQLIITGFVLAMLMIIWLVIELAFVVKS